jgi:hypothetical protein
VTNRPAPRQINRSVAGSVPGCGRRAAGCICWRRSRGCAQPEILCVRTTQIGYGVLGKLCRLTFATLCHLDNALSDYFLRCAPVPWRREFAAGCFDPLPRIFVRRNQFFDKLWVKRRLCEQRNYRHKRPPWSVTGSVARSSVICGLVTRQFRPTCRKYAPDYALLLLLLRRSGARNRARVCRIAWNRGQRAGPSTRDKQFGSLRPIENRARRVAEE